MKRTVRLTGDALRRPFFQRCFCLFVTLLALAAAARFRDNIESFVIRSAISPLDFTDRVYFNLSTLTTTGFGDIAPITRLTRTASVIEGIFGELFLAILISRLVGVYPTTDLQYRGETARHRRCTAV
ncbi:MAG TPA: potassium channel family protein [Steroidobacter sp.]|nr:potassium channel family protein [Steroidobacter sp.]